MATNRAEGHRRRDISPAVLGDFVKALAHLKAEGRPLETLLKEAIAEHGILKVLEVMSRYNPKTVDANLDANLEHRHINTNQLAEEVMQAIVQTARDQRRSPEVH